ncbi:MAG TPA: hypothetical protein PKE29_08620 [Phycisphaerales bacterium]|nr:hypothetical protein [Phycisphaerales bacterium]
MNTPLLTRHAAINLLAALVVAVLTYVTFATCQTRMYDLYAVFLTGGVTETGSYRLDAIYRGAEGVLQLWQRVLSPFNLRTDLILAEFLQPRVQRLGPIRIALPVKEDMSWWLPTIGALLLSHLVASLLLVPWTRSRALRRIRRVVDWNSVPEWRRLDALCWSRRVAVIAYVLFSIPVAVAVWFLAFDPGPIPRDLPRELVPGLISGPLTAVALFAISANLGTWPICSAARAARSIQPAQAASCRVCGYALSGLPLGTVCPECGIVSKQKTSRTRAVGWKSRAAVYPAILVVACSALLYWSEGSIWPTSLAPALQRAASYAVRFGMLFGWYGNSQHIYWRRDEQLVRIRWAGQGDAIVAHHVAPPGPNGKVRITCVWGWCPSGEDASKPESWVLHVDSQEAAVAGSAAYFDMYFGDRIANRRFYAILGNWHHMPSEGILYGRPSEIEALGADARWSALSERVKAMVNDAP